MADKPTLRAIADDARVIRSGYREAAENHRQYAETLRVVRQHKMPHEGDALHGYRELGAICQRYALAVGKLAVAVATHLPEVFEGLRLVGDSGRRWHEQDGFDWKAAEAELRRIEATALAAGWSSGPEIPPADDPPEVDLKRVGKGVKPRDDYFWDQYLAVSSETYHKPATIRKKWNALKVEERKAICPDSFGLVTQATVKQVINRAKAKAAEK